MVAVPRRAFLSAIGAVSATLTLRASADARTVRMRWPWPVRSPEPHSSTDLVAALVGAALFPPLYVRALDGMLEPRAAVGAPKEAGKGAIKGLRVDLAPGIRPSDVVGSISNARVGAGRLALRDVPVPRVDGAHGVIFPGLADHDALMRRLATPIAGIARIEPRKLLSTGPWDIYTETRESITSLRLSRRPNAPAVGMSAAAHPTRIMRFELDGAVDLGRSLRAFERYESDVAWLTDGLFAPRPGARPIDLGALAFLALRAGKEAPELQRPGTVLSIVDAIAPDRMSHLGLIRRGALITPESQLGRDPSTLAPNVPVLVRQSMPIAVAAAEILARDLGGIARSLDDATFDKAMSDGRFPLALDVMRPIDESPDGAATALATFDGATSAPPPNTGPRGVAELGSAALGWEIALIGAQASHVWIPRAPLGGLDLEVGGVG
jgi:peptide/nickel transport system substrate-binding protein